MCGVGGNRNILKMYGKLHILLVLLASIEYVLGAGEWNYKVGDKYGPGNWKDVNPTCGLKRQSPIDIQTSVVQYDESLGDFNFMGYDTAQANTFFDINNNGHAVGVNLRTSNQVQIPIELSGGGLDGSYILAQFHFHWGEDDFRGSEHHTDSKEYAAELHLVHYKKEYGNLSESLKYGDGLAVLGVHMEVAGDEANSGFTGFTKYLKNVTYEGNVATIAEYAIDRMLPENTEDYYRYMGSLTTPPCSEAVVWTVFKDSITISHDQMAEFRKVQDNNGERISNNYRPPQPLYGRLVYSSFDEPQPAPPSGSTAQIHVQLAFSIIFSAILTTVYTLL